MARHYVRLLEAVASSTTTPLRAIAMVDEDERSLLLTGFNPSPEEPAEQTFSNLFDTQAAQTPDAVAVAFGEEQLTYRQLQEAVGSIRPASGRSRCRSRKSWSASVWNGRSMPSLLCLEH